MANSFINKEMYYRKQFTENRHSLAKCRIIFIEYRALFLQLFNSIVWALFYLLFFISGKCNWCYWWCYWWCVKHSINREYPRHAERIESCYIRIIRLRCCHKRVIKYGPKNFGYGLTRSSGRVHKSVYSVVLSGSPSGRMYAPTRLRPLVVLWAHFKQLLFFIRLGSLAPDVAPAEA